MYSILEEGIRDGISGRGILSQLSDTHSRSDDRLEDLYQPIYILAKDTAIDCIVGLDLANDLVGPFLFAI